MTFSPGLPAFGCRRAAWPAAAGRACGRQCNAAAAAAPPSELAVLVVSRDRIHPVDQRAAHVAFGRNDLLGPGDDLACNRGRNDNDAVAVAENVVAGRDGDCAD